MTPVEKLQAAIDKLEMLKRESTPAAWFLTYERSTHPSIWGNADAVDADLVARTMRGHRDAELIVTLHRTIDAQLDLLDSARRMRGVYREVDGEVMSSAFGHGVLALAEAIIGAGS